MASISGNTIFIVVSLVLATMVLMNTLQLDNQGVIERKMLEFRTNEFAHNIEMISDFQNDGSMEYEFPVNYTISFGDNPASAEYPTNLTLAYNKKRYTTGVGVEMQSYPTFNGSNVCIRQNLPNNDIRTISMENSHFIRKYLIENVRNACNDGDLRNYPPEGKYSYTLNGVNAIKTVFKNTIGSNYVQIKIRYGGGSKESFKIDSNGYLANWACSGDPGNGMYQFNGSAVSASGYNGDAGNTGDWVNLDSSQVTRWRVMEENNNKYVNIQVEQVAPGSIPGDELVNVTKGECR